MKIKDLATGQFIKQPLEQRFWEKVKKTPTCWLWTAFTAKGYGRLRDGSKNRMATHVSWYIHHGKWPTLFMCHKCDNPSCVNPKHLFEGTHQDNTSDMVSKGRAARGSKSGNAVYTEKKVADIKHLLRKKYTPSQISKKTGVNYWSIIKIKNGKQWTHIPN